MATKTLTEAQMRDLQDFTAPWRTEKECSCEAAIRRINELYAEVERLKGR